MLITCDNRLLNLDTFDPVIPLQALGIRNLDTLHVSVRKVIQREFCIQKIPDDNSCLFTAIAFVTKSEDDPKVQRQLVHDHILVNRLQWNKAVLGEEPEEYARWITLKNSWGGAIELAIFSELYRCEICCFDVQTQRMLKFGEGNYAERVFVIYSGIHYDAIFEKEKMTTKFPLEDQEAVDKVMELVQVLNASHAYTDVANFTLNCDICGEHLRGEKEAETHATETKHFSFSEVN